MKLRTRLKEMGGSALIAFMMSFSLSCILLGAIAVALIVFLLTFIPGFVCFAA